MKMGAYQAANEYYYYGHNSQNGKYYHSMEQIATTQPRDIQLLYSTYVSYFDNMQNFAHDIITSVMNLRGLFAHTKAEQRYPLTILTMRYLVMVFQPLEKMNEAVQNCEQKQQVSANLNWDIAAAHFIGSMEGKENGGNVQGQMMYSVIKKNCALFGTCHLPGHDLIELLSKGKELIYTGNCDHLKSIANEIEKLLHMTLAQSTLVAAVELQRHATFAQIADGYISSMSILPIIDEYDSSSAEIIEEELAFKDKNLTQSVNSQRVFIAMERALKQMNGWNCTDIGSLEFYGGLCPPKIETVSNVEVVATTPLAEGRYIATNNIKQWVQISVDLENMRNTEDQDIAYNIYSNGKNALVEGMNVGLSLSNFSRNAMASEMKDDPMYNLFVYAFLTFKGEKFDGQHVTLYADTLVNDLFEIGKVCFLNRFHDIFSFSSFIILG